MLILQVYKHLIHRLTVFLSRFVRSRISYRDKHYGFERLGKSEEFTAQRHVKVAHPAGAQALLCSSQTQMLYGNTDIDIGMVFGL